MTTTPTSPAALLAEHPEPDRPIALVTGASRGIGRAIAEDLARTHVVLAVGRDADALAAVAAAQPAGRVLPVVADLADPAGLEAVFSGIERLDVLVHNAAIMRRAIVEDAPVAEWREALDTNVVAPAELTRVLLPALRRTRGIVVFLSSGAARRSVPFHTVYSATKHALLALADGLRQQVAGDGVRVSTVAPGPTQTPGGARSDDRYPPSEFQGEKSLPETIARSVRHVIDAPADSQVTDVWVRPRA